MRRGVAVIFKSIPTWPKNAAKYSRQQGSVHEPLVHGVRLLFNVFPLMLDR